MGGVLYAGTAAPLLTHGAPPHHTTTIIQPAALALPGYFATCQELRLLLRIYQTTLHKVCIRRTPTIAFRKYNVTRALYVMGLVHIYNGEQSLGVIVVSLM